MAAVPGTIKAQMTYVTARANATWDRKDNRKNTSKLGYGSGIVPELCAREML